MGAGSRVRTLRAPLRSRQNAGAGAGEGGDKALPGAFVGQEKVQSFHERDSA